VAWGGAGVRIFVVTVGKIGSVIKKQAKPAFAELIAIAFQVISAELIDYDYYDQLGTRVVGGRTGSAPGEEAHQQPSRHCSNRGGFHFAVVYR
jgi:hypothetical protein